ncbi:MAG: adenylate kinase [Clostridia bacterium]|nr:adenylate kinase [Clostridia bacterium]
MKKVIVIGCPGGGKSTFSRALHEITGLPLFHLDMLKWNTDKTSVSKPIFLERLQNVMEQDKWIIDGNYGSTMEMRMAACDTIFFLDYPTEVCIEGVISRNGKPRPDMPWIEKVGEFDEEFMKLIRNYNRDNRPKVIALLEKYADKEIVIFGSREDAAEYLQKIENGIKVTE